MLSIYRDCPFERKIGTTETFKFVFNFVFSTLSLSIKQSTKQWNFCQERKLKLWKKSMVLSTIFIDKKGVNNTNFNTNLTIQVS